MPRRRALPWTRIGKGALGVAGLALLGFIGAGIASEGRDRVDELSAKVGALRVEVEQAKAALGAMPGTLADLQRRLEAARQTLASESDVPQTLAALRRTAQEAGVSVTAAAIKPARPRGVSDEIPIALVMQSDAAKLLAFLERADGRFTTLTELFLTASIDAPTVVSSQLTLTVLVDRPERAGPPPPPAPQPAPASPPPQR